MNSFQHPFLSLWSPHAIAGLPMIFLVIPAAVFLFVPVVALEAWMARVLLRVNWRQSFWIAWVTNLISTAAGVPSTWLVLFFLEVALGGGSFRSLDSFGNRLFAVTVEAPWLVPYESEYGWMLPAAGLYLMIFFFFVSWGIEWFVAQRMLGSLENQLDMSEWEPAVIRARRWSFWANVLTYGGIGIYLLGVLLFRVLFSSG